MTPLRLSPKERKVLCAIGSGDVVTADDPDTVERLVSLGLVLKIGKRNDPLVDLTDDGLAEYDRLKP